MAQHPIKQQWHLWQCLGQRAQKLPLPHLRLAGLADDSVALFTSEERNELLLAPDVGQVERGEVPDFRMVIRGASRTTHGDSTKLSGRAKELAEKGFYFLKYSKKGANISDVWDIIPEDSQNRASHYAPFPEDLVKNPIALTCPSGGIVLDPFVGTGPTCKVARDMGRRSIGIDLGRPSLEAAEERLCTQ